jgi:hypothetical protein
VTALRMERCPARPSHQWRPVVIPLIVGAGSALALIGAYLGILTVGQSASHAMEQLAQDILLVSLAAIGLGTQIGLSVSVGLTLRTARRARIVTEPALEAMAAR